MEWHFSRPAALLLLLALSNSALHATIPSHWLSFAIVGRAQRWSMRQTILVTALAGTGHMLLTIVLGAAVVMIGKQVERLIPAQAEHAAMAIALLALGGYFVADAWRNGGGCHGHHPHTHDPDGTCEDSNRQLLKIGASPTTIGALIMGITLSPCLELVSLFAAGAGLPWPVLGAMSLIMAVTTIGLMTAFVWLTLHGLRHLKLQWLERNEGYIVGSLLMMLGAYVLFAP